ncbi:permease-like cell division protein FtsX [Dactylosporangium sp. NPDC051541]|uniref:permease-like cell division protein FtsX n=1 Tax=Dactylosporangium sp. NPDC051541 TaxID=3363977 RepID=UPI0037B17B00
MAVLGQTGCTAGKDEQKPRITYKLGVYFYEGATAEQRSAVEARLKTLPAVSNVHLLSGQDAYKVLESANPEAAKRVDPSGLPDSLRAVITDPTLIEPVTDLIGGMPEVSVAGDPSGGLADPKGERGVIVKVDDEGQADIENAIKAIPNASPAVFESGGNAYTRMRHRVDGLSPADALASYRFKVTVAGGISPEQQALATVHGVRRVIVVPASAL